MISAKDLQNDIAQYYKGDYSEFCVTTFDIKAAHRNFKISEEQGALLQFKTEVGVFKPTCLISDLNASAFLFQETLHKHTLSFKYLRFFADDGLLFTKRSEHAQDLINIFKILLDIGWQISYDKLQLMCKQVSFIGLLISSKGISIPQAKIDEYKRFNKLKILAALKIFIHTISFHPSMLPEFSILTEQFYKMKTFKWDEKAEHNYNRLIELLANTLYLQYIPNQITHFSVTAAVNNRAITSAIYWHSENEKGLLDLRGRTLKAAECNYIEYNKILLAVKEILEANKKIVYEYPIQVIFNKQFIAKFLEKHSEFFTTQNTFQRLRLAIEDFNISYKVDKIRIQ
uniref:Reverse transcriptase domain-containing protein n=1 Tax=Strongyloides papillosus TaxID=174720 RepID=A0A0N5C5T1_STREA